MSSAVLLNNAVGRTISVAARSPERNVATSSNGRLAAAPLARSLVELRHEAPLRFATRNLLFGGWPSDVWALCVPARDGVLRGLTDEQKKELFDVIASFAYASRRLHVAARDAPLVGRGLLARARPGSIAATAWRSSGSASSTLIASCSHQSIVAPELYLSVRLTEPRKGALDALAASLGEAIVQAAALARSSARRPGLADSRALSERLLRELAAREERAYQRVCDYFYVERATTARPCSGCCGGVVLPRARRARLDLRFRPQALVCWRATSEVPARSRPTVLRLFDHRSTGATATSRSTRSSA